MVDYIYAFPLTLKTLAVLFVLPFIYFSYHIHYWYLFRKLRQWDLLLSIVCVALASIAGIKIANIWDRASSDLILLHFLHFGPLIMTLFMIPLGQGKFLGLSNQQEGAATHIDTPDSGPSYVPEPVGHIKQVQWDQIVIDQSLKEELISVVELLKDPKTAHKYGIEVPKGILLNGPPGTGKTTIAKAIASTANLSFFPLKMDEIVSKWVGESEKNLTMLFNAALKHGPSVIFIDEVDAIGGMRQGQQQTHDGLLNHLLQLIDGIISREGIYIIGATNRADLVDTALKRSGRLNKVIEVPLPDFHARAQLFSLYLSRLPLSERIDIHELAGITEGKSGADICEICNQAGLNAFKRESAGGSKRREYCVRYADMEAALVEFMNQPNVVGY